MIDRAIDVEFFFRARKICGCRNVLPLFQLERRVCLNSSPETEHFNTKVQLTVECQSS